MTIKLEKLVGYSHARLRIKKFSSRDGEGISCVTQLYHGKTKVGDIGGRISYGDEKRDDDSNMSNNQTEYLADELRKAGYNVKITPKGMKIERKY
jgi:hypothetical protein